MMMKPASVHDSRIVEKDIGTIRFTTMSPQMILDLSVVHVTKEDSSSHGNAVSDGLLDPRMGPCDSRSKCHTCHQQQKDCPGHFGHIKLIRPVYNIGYFPHVFRIIRKVCRFCSLLLIHRDGAEFARYMEKEEYRNVTACTKVLAQCAVKSKNRRCSVRTIGVDGKVKLTGCGRTQPTYKMSNGYYIEVSETVMKNNLPTQSTYILKPSQAIDILSKISDQDMVLLGGDPLDSRLEWMVCTILPVPPYCMRPNNYAASKAESGDDITYKLCEILKHNNHITKMIDMKRSETEIDTQVELLQYHVATYMDNKISGVPQSVQRMGQPTKGIRQRLQRKNGRFRKNLNGKRCDNNARSVISPDPNLHLDEIGVPEVIANHLTVDEKVFDLNREKLQQTVWNGSSARNGANYVEFPKSAERANSVTINLAHVDPYSVVIEPGCIVRRHLRDGDYVLFNRQPSLHKTSMMGHRVRVMSSRTMSMNLSVTTPYNADFVCVSSLNRCIACCD